jgi:hypothetical protein
MTIPSSCCAASRPVVLLAVLGALVGTPLWAEEPSKTPESTEPRKPAATVIQDVGVLARASADKPFERVLKGEQVYTRDLLVCPPGLRVGLQTRSRAVLLTLWGNVPQLSESPVLESAVILHDNPDYDLDLTLVRGRVFLTNNQAKGPARIWVRGKSASALLTMGEPGDQIALEVFGRWPAGVPFSLKHKPGVAPIQSWEVHVIRGKLDITAGKNHFAMSGPPGPAYFRGDSVSGPDPSGPRFRASTPDWADPKVSTPATTALIQKLVDVYRKALKSKGAREALAEVLAAAEKDENRQRAAMARELAVYTWAATDEIPEVIRALADTRHPEMRKAAVIGLRQWIGAPGRDEVLYKALLKDHTPVESETIMSLLHSPFDAEHPESYEALIAYLSHGKLAVRELAYWHLVRMAPAGREIRYDPAGAPAERAKGVTDWRKLIPAGSLPGASREDKK